MLFHKNNPPGFNSVVVMEKSHESHYELAPPPLHSPDLVPNDFILVSNLKKWLLGKRYESKEEVIAATNGHFRRFGEILLFSGHELENRWTKCIDLKEHCVEKEIELCQRVVYSYLGRLLVDNYIGLFHGFGCCNQ